MGECINQLLVSIAPTFPHSGRARRLEGHLLPSSSLLLSLVLFAGQSRGGGGGGGRVVWPTGWLAKFTKFSSGSLPVVVAAVVTMQSSAGHLLQAHRRAGHLRATCELAGHLLMLFSSPSSSCPP